jgi:carbon monoxide dehydrogenase subunit G
MANFEMSEWIDASPRKVFKVLTDLPNAASYVKNIKSTVMTTKGALGVGSKFEETRIVNGKEASAELEVREYDADYRFAVGNKTEGIDVNYIYTLEKEDGGTRILWEAELSASGLRKMMVPMVAGILKKEDRDHLARLKQQIEK